MTAIATCALYLSHRERSIRVRGYGLTRVLDPLTPALSIYCAELGQARVRMGRGSAPSLPQRRRPKVVS